jgi:hypothetical protein
VAASCDRYNCTYLARDGYLRMRAARVSARSRVGVITIHIPKIEILENPSANSLILGSQGCR